MSLVTAPSQQRNRLLLRLFSTVLRVGLGAVWLVAGLLKVDDPDGMVRSVRAFRILPESLVHPVAYAVPFVEIALGVLLIVGLTVRLGAFVSAALFAVYIAAISSAAARGLRIDCGCFSTGGDLTAEAPTQYTEEIVRDSALLLASLLLARWPDGFLTVDRLLDRTSHPPLDDEDDQVRED
ncbi:DoxX family protein [Frankia sp. R43]|uniref:MauE/DoxX family redox-associated membrane protein n=1 Tax=Frankia sp. R43 TaxID=269536 RepID=UPI0006C9FAF0|nr:MauE/DoxX family redox-associated membrane protein [Frankia sp. R43]KPM56789.1 DoxX family protein [Frankia sp. R43]